MHILTVTQIINGPFSLDGVDTHNYVFDDQKEATKAYKALSIMFELINSESDSGFEYGISLKEVNEITESANVPIHDKALYLPLDVDEVLKFEYYGEILKEALEIA